MLDDIDIEKMKAELVSTAIPAPLHCGIYFLIKDGEIVYVGQAVDVYARVGKHCGAGVINFDSFNWFDYPCEQLSDMETEFILRFTPRLNTSIPACRRFVSMQWLKSKGIGRISFRKYLLNANCTRYSLADRTYYDIKELAVDPAFVSLLQSEGVSL